MSSDVSIAMVGISDKASCHVSLATAEVSIATGEVSIATGIVVIATGEVCELLLSSSRSFLFFNARVTCSSTPWHNVPGG